MNTPPSLPATLLDDLLGYFDASTAEFPTLTLPIARQPAIAP